MSIEQPLDPQLIEQTKRQIQVAGRRDCAVGEADRHARASSTASFSTGWCRRWPPSAGRLDHQRPGPAGPAIPDQPPADQPAGRRRRGPGAGTRRLLYKAMAERRRDAGAAALGLRRRREAANPTDFLLVLGAVADRPGDGRRGRDLPADRHAGRTCSRATCGSCCRCASWPATSSRATSCGTSPTARSLWSRLEDFTRAVHASLEPIETAYTIANEGRRLIECDRVSVAIRKGNRCAIEAVSGQDMFDKRSNTIRLLGRLATAVVATGEPVWYTGDTADLAPQVEEAVAGIRRRGALEDGGRAAAGAPAAGRRRTIRRSARTPSRPSAR